MRLWLVGVALALSSGCFQVETLLVLAPDGGGTYRSEVHMSETVLELMEMAEDKPGGISDILPAKPGREQAKAWDEQGLHGVQVHASRSRKHFGFDVQAAFDRPGALAALQLHGEAKGPRVSVRPDKGGEYILVINPDQSGQPPVAPPSPQSSGEDDRDPSKAVELAGKLLAELDALHIEMAVQVPGEILEVRPAWGTFEGGRASWLVNAETAMAIGQSMMDGGGPKFEAFEVRFRVQPGAALPASAVEGPIGIVVPPGPL